MNCNPSECLNLRRTCGVTFFVLMVCTAFSLAKTDVPLFLFSGQSNMVGLGTNVNDLSVDQKKTVDNVKIYLDAEGDASKKKKWLPLGPGFGSNNTQFGPELFFGKTLSDSMPDTKFAFIKDAVSGTYLGQTGGWLPPSSNNGTGGTLYKNMMTSIDAALKAFNDAYDTAQYTPRWAGFIWHQGEFDGWNNQQLANSYETNLTNLIKDIREKTGNDSLPVIVPMITGTMWQYVETVRTAEIAVAKKGFNIDTMDTKGYRLSDNIHYDAPSMVKVGNICALRWLAMNFLDVKVPVVYRTAREIAPPEASIHVFSTGSNAYFDLSGRKYGEAISSLRNPLVQRSAPVLMICNPFNRRSPCKTVYLAR